MFQRRLRMVSRRFELKLNISGVDVIEQQTDFGYNYKFKVDSCSINLNLTELTIGEFYDISKKLDDFTEYNIMEPYNVRTITGYDWELSKKGKRIDIKKILKTIELLGKRYTGTFYPDIMYYDYEDGRLHKHYQKWIEFMGYKLIHENEIAMYYREKTNDI